MLDIQSPWLLALAFGLATLAVISLFLASRRRSGRVPSTLAAGRLPAHDPMARTTVSADEGRCEQLLQIANLAAFDWDGPNAKRPTQGPGAR